MEITKEEFEEYERIRSSGETNMFNIEKVLALSDNLTREKCLIIMRNYEPLLNKFGIQKENKD